MRERIPLFAGLALLALAVALGSAFIADGIRDRNRSDGGAARRVDESRPRILRRPGREGLGADRRADLDAQPGRHTKLSGLRPQLLTAATQDAQRRARVIVAASGARLGNLR